MGEKSLPQEWIDKIALWARGCSAIDSVFVFGSRARGDNKPESDLDLAVLLTLGDSDEALAYWIFESDKLKQEVTNLIPVPVDLQLAEPRTDERVWPGVKRDGRKVYSKMKISG